jgi:hypothetical protein
MCILGFYKSSAKDMAIPIIKDFGWWQWWITFSLITNCIGLKAWWRISDTVENGGLGMVQAVFITTVIALVVDVVLLSIHYNIEVKNIIALVLVAIASYIVNEDTEVLVGFLKNLKDFLKF